MTAIPTKMRKNFEWGSNPGCNKQLQGHFNAKRKTRSRFNGSGVSRKNAKLTLFVIVLIPNRAVGRFGRSATVFFNIVAPQTF